MRMLAAVALLLLAGRPLLATDVVLFVPAAAHAAGRSGSLWETELRLLNPGASDLTVSVAFLPATRDNRDVEGTDVTLPARRGLLLPDVVARTLGGSGGGALRLRAPAPFLAASRTLNAGNPSAGLYGLSVPAVPPSAAVTRGLVHPLTNVSARTNAGFVNPGESLARASLELRDADDGATLATGEVEVPPLGFVQVDDVFASLGSSRASVAHAVLSFRADRPLLSWATVIDSVSGDGSWFAGEADPEPVDEPPAWQARFTLDPAEGLAWQVEPGFRWTAKTGGGGVPRVVVLQDGRYRLYSPSPQGLQAATSSDGYTFVDEPGTYGPISDAAVIYLRDGGFRFLWPSGPNGAQVLVSATSPDGLTFTPEPGERFRPAPRDAGFVQVPHAVLLPDGRWRLYYVADWFGAGGSPFPNSTRTAVSSDEGLTWTAESDTGTGRDTVDPDVVPLAGEGYRLYYKERESFRTADSADGVSFPGSGVSGRAVLDAANRFDPTVLKLPDGTVRMFYGTPGGIASAVATDAVRR